MTGSFVYYWKHALAPSFTAILSGIGRQFKRSVDKSNKTLQEVYHRMEQMSSPEAVAMDIKDSDVH